MKIKGHAVTNSREAPVIVIAPHSTFFDAVAIVCLGAPSVVARADTARLPFIGRMFFEKRTPVVFGFCSLSCASLFVFSCYCVMELFLIFCYFFFAGQCDAFVF